MKRMMMLAVALLVGGSLYAQTGNIALSGVVEKADGTIELHAPESTLAVDVTVRCERVICGPYARYAQKFLGVRAPLTDKCEWQVTGAAIALADAASLTPCELPASTTAYARHAAGDEEFARVQIDKNSTFTPTLEAAAEAAASTIFSLRKHRMELITGEAGEQVFGEGLRAALAEIDRQEQAYLELFLGKHITTTTTERFFVTPEAEKLQYVVCRFSPEQGLLPSSDLMGNMILLQITPAEKVVSPVPEAGPKDMLTATCVVANRAACRILVAGEERAFAELPLYQFGRTVTFALPRRK